jgi:hypothetical protein
MTGMLLGLTVFIAAVAQAPDRGRDVHQPAARTTPKVDLSQVDPNSAQPTPPGEKPFGKLFGQEDQRAQLEAMAKLREAVASREAKSKIVCGMVVIEADPGVDPKFVHRPTGDTSGMKIRRIQPNVCVD